MIKVARTASDVQAALPGIEPLHLPSVEQFNMWRNWVRWTDGCDPKGTYIGWCPVHDRDKKADIGLAWYNFSRGVFECTEACCHEGKRGMTLVDLALALAKRALNGG